MAKRFRPHVIHVHNTFPLFSNGVFRALRGIAPRVLTLHNYRIVCPAGIPMRGGTACTLCMDRRSAWPGVYYACYRNSSAATAPLAMRAAIDKVLGTWAREIDAFIVLSDFQKALLGRAGIPIPKMHVRANPYYGTPQPVPWSARANHVVFVGRLAAEKGVADLIEAWRFGGGAMPWLRVVGDGPARAGMEQAARGLRVEFIGAVEREVARAEIAKAKLVVVPSRCFEGFPLVVSEALSHGTPLAVADIGPLGEIVRDANAGRQFAAGNPAALWEVIGQMWNEQRELQRYSANALAAYGLKYTDTAAFSRLLEVYALAGVPRSSIPL